MSKVRNIYDHALMIHVRGVWHRVEPDSVVEVPDDELASYVERVDGDQTVPSDLWVEAADIAPTPEVAS